MNFESLEKELEEWEGDVYFISILPQYVWSETEKRVVSYSDISTKANKLIVKDTCQVNLENKKLIDYFNENQITIQDVLVFCINEDYLPKKKGKWINFSVIKNVNKKKNITKREENNEI